MPPDDRERSELDEALFSDGRADSPADPAPRPAPPDLDLPGLEAALFGDAAAADPTDPSPAVEPPLEWASNPDPYAAPESDAESDSTAVFAAVPPPPVVAEPVELSRRQRRRATGAERGSGPGKRLGFAALVVLLVAGLGGLAYAALGSDDDVSPTKGVTVEVQGSEATRTTLGPTTSSSSTTTSSSTTSTTSTTKPTATTRASAVAPATETPATDAPVLEQPPPTAPPTEPPTVPTTQQPPPPPPTTTTTTTLEPPPAT